MSSDDDDVIMSQNSSTISLSTDKFWHIEQKREIFTESQCKEKYTEITNDVVNESYECDTVFNDLKECDLFVENEFDNLYFELQLLHKLVLVLNSIGN